MYRTGTRMAPPDDRPDALFLALQAALAGRYSLERELGRGGMGVVYLARDVRLDRPVALKLLPPDRAAQPEIREGFLREARMAARLAHPNIVSIHSVDEAGEFVFYAMRHVAGESLGDRLRRVGHLAPHEAARILRDTAYALAYAHAQGVIHRDIKPDNILLDGDGGPAMVTDFGIARLTDTPDARQGRVVGTPEYISPEQAAGEPVDARSDLYSLGAMGFHCLAGRPPFIGDVNELLAQHLTQAPPALLDLAPETPAMLAAAIDRSLRKQPDERFPSAEAMAEALIPGGQLSAELPVPVRIWVERGRELKSIYAIWSCFFFGLATMVYVAATMNQMWTLASVVFELLLLKAAVLPWIGHGLWRLLATRRALESGVTLDDLRHGLDVAVDRREEERRYESGRPVHFFPKLVRIGTYLAFAGAIGSLFGGRFLSHSEAASRLFFQLFGLFSMTTVAGGLFGLIFPGRRLALRDAGARLRRTFWESRFGDLVARIATTGLPAARQGIWASSRPTESALGSATETLFAALPGSERAALEDLPQVVERLEREAALARERLAAGVEGQWAARLERSVAAIETLRVGLLRMTVGHVAASSLTADLDAARELSTRIDYLVAGADEVAAALADGTSPSHESAQALPSRSPATTSLG
jgi:hypothetical protein